MKSRGFPLTAASCLLAAAHGLSGRSNGHPNPCPPFNKGNFTISQYQLYPENAFWDTEHCVVYFSALFNGSVAVYDPYRDTFPSILTFPGITHAPGQHSSGIDHDPHTNLLSIVIDSENPFLTEGADVAGDNWLIKYDVARSRELWRANLTAVTRGLWGGFQDVAVDSQGNSFVIGTYPKSILKVDKHGRNIEVWYLPQTSNTTVHGYTGVAAVGDTLLVVDNEGVPESSAEGRSEIYRFDLTEKKGTPVLVQRTPRTPIGEADKIHLPPAYGGKVLLVAEDLLGATVLRSTDGWRTAEHLGTVRSGFPKFFERIVPSTIQIGPRRQYMIGQYFPGTIVPGTTAGNRTDFPMFDITEQVEAMLKA
ncbi:hypothetical protein B0T25DRAFT_451192 [Lasiosphaeria hispida]|uniref:TRI14-like protein n=1 Tax=Lasiosphaeria hispida TaxID=260671 RepID=A0AAJ0HMU9_9PEZI|nr:hypothetical protein B0T25DRAFT_451192 [Lasiosphaeria hispida]